MADSNTLGPQVQATLERVAQLARTAQQACEKPHILATESPSFDPLLQHVAAIQGAPAAATRWRATRPDLAGRGVVVVNRDGEACGWMDALRNPEHWEPGCRAVDVEGCEWVARGGDDYNGASEWVPGGVYDDGTAGTSA